MSVVVDIASLPQLVAGKNVCDGDRKKYDGVGQHQ